MTLEAHRDNFENSSCLAWRQDHAKVKAERQGNRYIDPDLDLAWQAYQWALADADRAQRVEQNEHLEFIERWAVHHASKPHVAAEEALGIIAHYPPIKAITKSYVDGVIPDTFDPYAEIERLKAELAKYN